MSRRGRTAICFLAMGQSLAANGAMPREPRFKARHGAVNFFDGKCYRAEDPLLGGGGDGNAIWTILADRLIGQGGYNSAVAAVFAEGGTTVEDWAFYPAYVQRAAAIDAQMRKAGLHLSAVLWMQGEEDSFPGRTTSQQYVDRFRTFASALRAHGIFAPIYVAEETRCASWPIEPIASAQRRLPDFTDLDIRRGPNIDKLGFGLRYDGCHLIAPEGTKAAADLWFDVLTASPTAGRN